MTPTVFLGDVLQLTLTASDPDTGAAADLSTYDSVKIVLSRPRSGTALSLTATLLSGGTTGQARITTTPGQLDTVGNWTAQIVGYVGTDAYHHSTPFTFQVG